MFSLFIIVIAALAFTSTSTAQELKLGIVASEVVIQNYSKFQEAEKQLGREMQGWQAERKTWEADMERLQNSIMGTENKLQAGQNMMSEKKKTTDAKSNRFFKDGFQHQAAKSICF